MAPTLARTSTAPAPPCRWPARSAPGRRSLAAARRLDQEGRCDIGSPIAQFAYVGVHLPIMLGVLAWTWFARPRAFSLARNTFVCAQALATLGYVLLPTAPPRMVPQAGYGADLAQTGQHGLERLAMSPYAAMPSGHAAFALVAAGIVATQARSKAVRAVAVLYPAVVLGEIIATGNHLWLDAVAGATVAAAGVALARGLSAVAMARRLRSLPI